MAGTRKQQKLDFTKMTKEETRKYYNEQMERAKKVLEQKTKMGDEKGIKRAEEVIRDLNGMISRL